MRRAALTLDLLAIPFGIATYIALLTGGTRFDLGGTRISIRDLYRPLAIGVGILVIRHLFVSYRPGFERALKAARVPLPLDDAVATPGSRRHAAAWLTLAALLYTGLTVFATWPQAIEMHSVSDLGDPLFSIWRLNWVAHALFTDPMNLFNGNIFYPEPRTLTYSDAMLVPALLHMPLRGAGLSRVAAYNVMLLGGFVVSGLTMFALVRRLTGRVDAALVSGALFTIYPYRLEHYGHLELQMTMWMPLVLLFLHRTLTSARWRDGLLTGLFFALQMLSSLYYGVFLVAYLAVVGAILWIGRGFPTPPLKPLVAGGVLAAVLVAPVAAVYQASKPTMGDRDVSTVQFYSALGTDYMKAHETSLVYGRPSPRARAERELFPRWTPIVLTAFALPPPLSVARIAYSLGLVLALDGSLGYNGRMFPWLHDYVLPFRGLRVPARFSMLAGMTLCILAGYGFTRLVNAVPPRAFSALALTASLAAMLYEAQPRLGLAPVWNGPPAVYSAIPEPDAVIAELPLPPTHLRFGGEFWFLYFSTFHWHRMVNGNSGFHPESYKTLLEHEVTFPSDEAVDYLKTVGVSYVTVHEGVFGTEWYRDAVAKLDQRADMTLVTTDNWEKLEVRLYRLDSTR